MEFIGFDPSLREFLHTIKEKNSREWYNSHKEQCKELVYKPFSLLIEDLSKVIYEIDSKILTAPSKCISRIYRDARFSKDKTLYRENVWINFKRATYDDMVLPSFYFEISREGYSYGMGYYNPSPMIMSAFRKHISEEPHKFRAALKSMEKHPILHVEGEIYKKPKLSEIPSEFAAWGYYKSFYVTSGNGNINNSDICLTSELTTELSEAFKALSLLYNFLIETPVPTKSDKLSGNDILL
ncbi:MAG: hypothetical protein K0S55_1338 [Clostridia bacterium]|nr:hypothetical protein [Clostridia bacterium]